MRHLASQPPDYKYIKYILLARTVLRPHRHHSPVVHLLLSFVSKVLELYATEHAVVFRGPRDERIETPLANRRGEREESLGQVISAGVNNASDAEQEDESRDETKKSSVGRAQLGNLLGSRRRHRGTRLRGRWPQVARLLRV